MLLSHLETRLPGGGLVSLKAIEGGLRRVSLTTPPL